MALITKVLVNVSCMYLKHMMKFSAKLKFLVMLLVEDVKKVHELMKMDRDTSLLNACNKAGKKCSTESDFQQ